MNYECLQCETAEARHESYFCSQACRVAFAAQANGPVRCDECSNEVETKEEAEASGWIDVCDTPDGFCWNQQGLCPECQCESVTVPARDPVT